MEKESKERNKKQPTNQVPYKYYLRYVIMRIEWQKTETRNKMESKEEEKYKFQHKCEVQRNFDEMKHG